MKASAVFRWKMPLGAPCLLQGVCCVGGTLAVQDAGALVSEQLYGAAFGLGMQSATASCCSR